MRCREKEIYRDQYHLRAGSRNMYRHRDISVYAAAESRRRVPGDTGRVKNDEPAEEPESEAKKDPVVIPIDFASLQARNPDVYAWITVPGTNIDYPILQSDGDNSYYLDHTMDGESSPRDRSLRRNITAKILKTLIP